MIPQTTTTSPLVEATLNDTKNIGTQHNNAYPFKKTQILASKQTCQQNTRHEIKCYNKQS